MNINVSPDQREHFWDEPPPDTAEFWAFRFKPPCKEGDELVFRFDGVPVAKAQVLMIEKPGLTSCAHSGRFKNRWKVLWDPGTFRKL